MKREQAGLERGLGLRGAVALNLADMVGVGPFITIPLIIQAMGGPQAMLGWICGAGFALCDGFVWAELGASFPEAGGTYRYLSRIYGEQGWGRLLSFLFVWQLLFSAPLTIASGCIGLALYSTYLWPGLDRPLVAAAGPVHCSLATLVAVAAALGALGLACRRVRGLSRLSQWLAGGVLFTTLWVIVGGVTHFSARRAFDFPPHAFQLSSGFLLGLGSAMLIATYDYWGYENANFLGSEVLRPERTLPRAILTSIGLVAVLYLAMNISLLGVVPWRELMGTGTRPVQSYVVSVMMERVYGVGAARLVTGLIVWTAFASVFALLAGYSRVLYAAAQDGNFFAVFGRLDPGGHFPRPALLALGLVTACFCVFRLDQVIAALVVIRLVLQYLLQAVGLLLLRRRGQAVARPFRMPLYPVPALVAIGGFVFILFAPAQAGLELRVAAAVLVSGVGVFCWRARRERRWPFAAGPAS